MLEKEQEKERLRILLKEMEFTVKDVFNKSFNNQLGND